MTPKQKAKELVKKMNIKYKCDRIGAYITINTAENSYSKECALIAVDEMITYYQFCLSRNKKDFYFEDMLNWFKEVKKEIENL
jgi:hypothetical protein